MPLIGRLHIRRRLVTLCETLLLIRWKRRRALAWRIRGFVRKPRQVIFVDPSAITRLARLRPGGQFHRRSRPRDVVSGKRRAGMILDDGDIGPDVAFDAHWVVRASLERWTQGKDWKETEYRTGYRGYVEKGLVRDWDEFARTRLERWDRLFADLSRGPYRRNADPLDEVQVAVAPDGEILCCDGRHRLAAARFLGYESIPVIVNFWSKSFIDRVGHGLTPREMARFLRGGGADAAGAPKPRAQATTAPAAAPAAACPAATPSDTAAT